MRGSSALQQAMDVARDEDVRVIVAWEPVLPIDFAPPRSAVLARVHDPRAVQLWDPRHVASESLMGALLGRPRADWRVPVHHGIAWDAVALYPPAARWDAGLPAPAWAGGPVLDVAHALPARLRELAVTP